MVTLSQPHRMRCIYAEYTAVGFVQRVQRAFAPSHVMACIEKGVRSRNRRSRRLQTHPLMTAARCTDVFHERTDAREGHEGGHEAGTSQATGHHALR
jgi:hypothetical protein